jgi:hypothetical protein
MAKQDRGPSWIAITIGFILFWPVGLYLLIKKLTTDREAAVKRDSKIPVLGWILLIFGVFFLSSYLSSSRNTLFIWAVFFIFGGLLSLRAAKRGNLEGERFRSYINAIVNHGLVSIQDIAAFAQVREKTAVKDLKRMIGMGYFDHAHIDEKRGEIYLYQRQAHVNVSQRYYANNTLNNNSVKSKYSVKNKNYDPAFDARDRANDRSATVSRDAVSWDFPPSDFASIRDKGSQAFDKSEDYGVVEKMTTCRNCGAQNWVTPGVRNTCEYCGSPISA